MGSGTHGDDNGVTVELEKQIELVRWGPGLWFDADLLKFVNPCCTCFTFDPSVAPYAEVPSAEHLVWALAAGAYTRPLIGSTQAHSVG